MAQDPEQIPKFQLYGEIAPELEFDFIHVESIAARSRLHNWQIQPHRHGRLHQLLLITDGGGRMRLDATERELCAPMAIRIPPLLVHGFAFTPETQGLVLTVAESFLAAGLGSLAEPALTEALAMPLVATVPPEALAALAAAFQSVADEFLRPRPGRASAIAAQLTLILVTLLRLDRAPDEAERPTPDAGLAERFRRLVEAEFRSRRKLAAYAATLGVSEARLNAACRRAAGSTALQLIHGRRLVEAQRLLIYTSMTVAEIGYALGFEDPAYFTRFFAGRLGLPPGEFRRRHAAPAPG